MYDTLVFKVDVSPIYQHPSYREKVLLFCLLHAQKREAAWDP